MKISKQLFLAVASGILVGASVIHWLRPVQSNGQPAEAGNPTPAKTAHSSPPATKSSERPSQPKPSKQAPAPRADVLSDLVRRWDELAKDSKGEALLAKQHALAMEAVKLGGSAELLRFLKFLGEKGAGDLRNRIIGEVGAEIFSGANAKEAREWLVTLDDPKLREKLCYLAGKDLPRAGLKDYIAAFQPDDHSESAVLVGYCRELAKTDPEGAVKTFVELRPSNVTYDGYAEIMAALPPTANFAKLSADLPDDSKALAKKARTALLQTWSATQPEDAAQYVLANSNLAFPEQMAVVVEKWANQSPAAATEWIGELSPGKPHDEGTAALARHWTATDPVKAWEFAGNVGDFKKRVETATVVFKEWEKTDHAAATSAWTALFPGE